MSPGSIVSLHGEDDEDLELLDDESSTAGGKRRRTLKSNALRKRFPSSYRNASNKNTLFGRQVSLGKAVTLLLPTMFGIEFPTEKVQYRFRERIFRAAGYYALSDEEIEAVFAAGSVEREEFLLGLVTASAPKLRYDLGNAARAHFQEGVFCSIARDPTIQKELGFDLCQSLFDM